MPRFAANLSMLFTEVPFLDRFERAARTGFEAVEFLFPYEFPAEEIRERIDRHRLQIVLQGVSAASNGEDVSSPELTIDNLELQGITYDADAVTGYLSVESLASEPFPCHTMNPSTFPGLF